jgi:single-strand DNA-binding protein
MSLSHVTQHRIACPSGDVVGAHVGLLGGRADFLPPGSAVPSALQPGPTTINTTGPAARPFGFAAWMSIVGRPGFPFPCGVRFRALGHRRFPGSSTHHPPRRPAVNTVNLIGRLTADPELRATRGGKSVTTIRIAIARRPGNGGEDRGAAYFDVEVWGATAENVAKYVTKGREVAISGRLEHQEWTTKDEQPRSKVYVVAEAVQFLGRPKDDAAPAAAPAEPVAA